MEMHSLFHHAIDILQHIIQMIQYSPVIKTKHFQSLLPHILVCLFGVPAMPGEVYPSIRSVQV